MSMNEKLFIASLIGVLVFAAFGLLALWADKPVEKPTKPRGERRPEE